MAGCSRSAGSLFLFTLVIVGALGIALAPGVSALSCVIPKSEWAEIRVHDVHTDEVLARVPFSGHWPGYECNIGNLHAIEDAWLGFMAHDQDPYPELEYGAMKPGVVHVVNLEDGTRGSMQAGTAKDIFAMSIAGSRPHVFLLTRSSDGADWVVHRMIPTTTHGETAAIGGARLDSIKFQAHHVVLHGRYAALLTDHQSTQPRVIIHDLIENREVASHEPAMPAGAAPPWRLMDATPEWLVIAANARGHDSTLHEDASVYIHETAKAKTYRFPSPRLGDDPELAPAQYGAIRIDGDRIVSEVWRFGWSPDRLQVRMLPTGTPVDLGTAGLMRGIGIDGGRIVKGSYLQEEPADARAWISDDAAESRFQTLHTSVIPAPTMLLVMAATALVIAMLRRKRIRTPLRPSRGPL